MSALGPGCVKTSVSRGCRELFSHFRLLAEVASAIEFPHLRNLERCSTRKLNDGVFTQPESFPDISAVWTLVCFISTNGHCHQCVAPAEYWWPWRSIGSRRLQGHRSRRGRAGCCAARRNGLLLRHGNNGGDCPRSPRFGAHEQMQRWPPWIILDVVTNRGERPFYLH